jgi:peroxiredoxin
MLAVSVLLVAFSGAGSIAADRPGIAATIEDLAPIAVGDRAPGFTVLRNDGSAFVFQPDALRQPTLIIFYRGGWCGACNEQLQDVASVLADIRAMGVDVLFPNGDRPEILYSSLKAETAAAIDGLDYTLLSDSELEGARAFRVAYVLADDVLERYRAREHWDLRDSSIDKYDALPLPSIFLVDAEGIIVFRFFDFDPRVRLPAEKLKEKIAELTSGGE